MSYATPALHLPCYPAHCVSSLCMIWNKAHVWVRCQPNSIVLSYFFSHRKVSLIIADTGRGSLRAQKSGQKSTKEVWYVWGGGSGGNAWEEWSLLCHSHQTSEVRRSSLFISNVTPEPGQNKYSFHQWARYIQSWFDTSLLSGYFCKCCQWGNRKSWPITHPDNGFSVVALWWLELLVTNTHAQGSIKKNYVVWLYSVHFY